MIANEIRKKYLKFFKERGHKIVPSASLSPENDPTTLFTTAGMHPLVPYLMGENHPEGNRIVNIQKCVRTTDIDEVGDTTHHTFFEMMGNWSFGDYFKKESIEMSWEFLTAPKWLGLDKNRLAVSVFKGDNNVQFDEESFNKWKELGVSEARIARLGNKENWWGPAGETGPCGPDTEIFYWVGDSAKVPESFNDDHKNWVEIWNNVFMEFEKTKDGKFISLKQKNVDTGMGLERMLAVMSGLDDNYKTELFWPIIEKIEKLSGKKYGESGEITKSMRIIVDHIKVSIMIMGDDKGVAPSNTDQGYVVRRLIRRAIRYGRQLEIKENNWTIQLAEITINIYKKTYCELEKNQKFILDEIKKEEEKFSKTLEKGLKILNKKHSLQIRDTSGSEHTQQNSNNVTITGKEIFDLYQTYGFPFELTMEELEKQDFFKDIKNEKENLEKEFNEQLKKHQELSRTASAGKFKGGLADNGEETKKLHTIAHLMLAALRKVLGNNVYQKGSNITAERLRFDFSYGEKLTNEQKEEIEKLVNETIEKKLPVNFEEMSLDEARKRGAEGVFDNKYGDKVKVYKVGEGKDIFSYEICGGPHIKNTGELGHFKIVKEKSSGAGVRRIKAVVK